MSAETVEATERGLELAGDLESDVARLANGVGPYLDEIAVPEDGTDAIEEFGRTAHRVRSTHELVGSLQDARESGIGRERAFASGAVHALEEILKSYTKRLHEQRLDEGEADSSHGAGSRVCAEMGATLADLRFGAGWRLLVAAKGRGDSEDTEGGRGYADGMEYALKRSLTSFRAKIEDRANRVLASSQASDEARQLGALLFIAVTDASRSRVQATFGAEMGDTVDALDKERLIRCTTATENPSLRVTPRGAAKAYRLSQEFEASLVS